ncbi:MAG TPA: type II toxin-antitoxin system VapC family toxin [Bradyrhizobium sp.]|nr:type II toxin-antitoxin system VapC family toxin [Bradyrhizobium sp.]
MFVDSSVFVAILTNEPEARDFSNAIEAARRCYTCGIARLETVMTVSTRLDAAPVEVDAAFDRLLEERGIGVVDITDAIAREAVAAFARYGKGRGHPARLNLGDCLIYASAKAHREPLLYKGADFAKTDIKPARGSKGGE